MSNRNITLLRSDFKIIGRDPMLLLCLFAPILLLVVALVGFPLISQLCIQLLNFSLLPYFPFGNVFLMILLPMLMGMIYGFILLDERDAGLINYISVTPLGKNGYLLLRIVGPTLLSFVFCLIFAVSTGMLQIVSWPLLLAVSLVISLEAPIMLLFLGAFASNKVEGIAISKGFGILMISMILDYFLTGAWRVVLAVSPLWWVGRSVFAESHQWLYVTGGLLLHLLFIWGLYRRFNLKT